jgi:hypothetical protein
MHVIAVAHFIKHTTSEIMVATRYMILHRRTDVQHTTIVSDFARFRLPHLVQWNR